MNAPTDIASFQGRLRSAVRVFPLLRELLRCREIARLIAFLFAVGPALGAQVNLTWDPNPESDIAGYRVYRGDSTRAYSTIVDAGTATTLTIENLVDGATYYFAVTAVNTSGLESDYSNEVVYSVSNERQISTPTIALTSPTGGSSFTAPATVNLAADVTANGNTITKVQFLNGSTLLGESTSAPYAYSWGNVSAGSYTVSARVIYGSGQTVDSAAAGITVANPPPTIALTSPTGGSSFAAPATVNLAASVTANGNTITKVQFFNGSTLLGESTSAPYAYSWDKVSAGSYTLSARAVYGNGQAVDSGASTISVNGLSAPWNTLDIGTGGVVGSAWDSSGQTTVQGSGKLSGVADTFRFVYQSLSGDGQITARLSSASFLSADARIGVMIRENLTDASAYVFMGASSGYQFRWQFRPATAGQTTTKVSTAASPPQMWVRLVRAGSRVTGFRSVDGINWTQVGSRNMNMAANIQMGFAVASGSWSELDTAVFVEPTIVP